MIDRLPRPLHPGAWWLWAIGLATAATRTTNPLVLLTFAAVAGCVVAFRRTDAPWARGFGMYLKLGLVVIAIRIVFRIVFDAHYGKTTLFRLPEISLPDAAAGVRLGGPVTLEGVLGALYDGIKLATLLLCVGAANVLADAKRLLKTLPGALHEVGVAVTVALTVAPQMIESAHRIRRARHLRGATARGGAVRGIVIPVLEDALDRSLVLAAAMDGRGYGRTAAVPSAERLLTSVLVLFGVSGVCVGVYGILDATTPRALGVPMLTSGCVVAVVGLKLTSRRVRRSVYRPDPWRLAEWAVVASGAGAAALMYFAGNVDPDNLFPTLQPLRWPTLGVLPAIAAGIALLPAALAPPVHRTGGTTSTAATAMAATS